MNRAIKTTIDTAGRLVVPKVIREQAGIGAGDTLTLAYRDGRIEIEPATPAVRIEERQGLRVAEPADSYGRLHKDTVRRTRSEIRAKCPR